MRKESFIQRRKIWGLRSRKNRTGAKLYLWRVNTDMLVRINWMWPFRVCTALARATHHKDPFVVEGEANGEKVVENYEGERLGRLQQQLRQEHRHVYKDPYYESRCNVLQNYFIAQQISLNKKFNYTASIISCWSYTCKLLKTNEYMLLKIISQIPTISPDNTICTHVKIYKQQACMAVTFEKQFYFTFSAKPE